MAEYTIIDSQIHCEELNLVSEAEYNEVMQLMAEEAEVAEGYKAWSESLEEKDYLGGYSNRKAGARHEGWAI